MNFDRRDRRVASISASDPRAMSRECPTGGLEASEISNSDITIEGGLDRRHGSPYIRPNRTVGIGLCRNRDRHATESVVAATPRRR